MPILSKLVQGTAALGTAGLGSFYTYVYMTTPKPVDTYNPKPQPRVVRADNLARLKTEAFDLVVIGGGATGSAVALDGASRGLKVALVERYDFSSGTSSRSTKLLHGGVRYLKDAFFNLDFGQLKLVYEALRERAHMIAASPHISQPLSIIIPLYSVWDVVQYWGGIKVYEMAAQIATLFNTRIPNSYFMGKSATLYQFPLLRPEGLKGSIAYSDGSQNDSRVNTLMALTATVPDYIPGWESAAVANHVSVTGVRTEPNSSTINGVYCKDELTGETFTVTGKVVINATGPFADAVRKMANPEAIDLITPAAGVHIVAPSLYSQPRTAMLIPETSDGRVLFYINWEGNTLIGTTDSKSELTPLPVASQKDVDFIVNESVKYLDVSADDVKRDITAAWSGIRPLVRDPTSADTSKLSRDHVVEVDEKSGLITIAGGKWTTSRLMAEHTVDKALEVHRGKIHAKHPCRTWFLKLIGTNPEIDSMAGSDSLTQSQVIATRDAMNLSRNFGIEYDDAMYLVRNYGSQAALDVCELGKARNSLTPLVPHQRVLKAELQWAVEHEMAETVCDVIGHRTRLAFVEPNNTRRILSDIVEELGAIKNWSTERKIKEFDEATKFLATMTYAGSVEPKEVRRRTYARVMAE
jgi:glycerol-3-phosphate dehydrogenase